VLLDEPHVLLLELAWQRRVLMGVSSRVVELALPGAAVQCIVVHDHVVRATLEAKSLLVLVRLGRLGCFPVVLLELLASGAHELIVRLGVDDDLVRIVPIVAAVEDLILILNLTVVRQLSRVVNAYLSASFT